MLSWPEGAVSRIVLDMHSETGGTSVSTSGPTRGRNHRRASRRRVVGIILAVLTFLGLVALEKPAQACDFETAEDAIRYTTIPDVGDTTPPIISAADISIHRADDPGSHSGDCSGIGSYKITVEASDEQTAREDLGLAFTVVDGSFPFRLPQGDIVGNDDGNVSSGFPDEGEAFDGTLEVRVIDRAGNRSEPKLVSASGDEVGCSCSAAGALSTRYGWFLPLAVLMLLVRRRFACASVCS